ncbi:MAG: hypothetical protein NVS3B14_11940 [Ktedonobacteraceae bacterium]
MPPLSRRVAIKVMSLERVADEQSVELFAREVSAIAALDHPNVLPVLRAGILDDGRSYLVMKYAAHGSLQKFCQAVPQELSILPTAMPASEAIAAGANSEDVSTDTVIMADEAAEESTGDAPGDEGFDESRTIDLDVNGGEAAPLLTPQQLLPFVEGAAAALRYAHEHNLIHLDVKPANLLLDANDHLLLADFGVSAIMDGYTHASLHCYVGTPVYTAPEQWLEQPRPASDQYALAVTCYQLLTGHLPFTGNLYSIMHGHLRTQPPSLHDWNPYIPEQVEAVILRALAKESTERYRDMLAFAAAYRDAVELAANVQTDAQGGKPTIMLASRAGDRAVEELPTAIHAISGAKAQAAKTRANEGEAAPSSFDQAATIDDELVPVQDRGKLQAPPRKNWGRMMVLILLALLLVSGGTLGGLRLLDPCIMGSCPGLKVSTNVVDITNSASQAVKITNSGTADLDWSVSPPPGVPWLSYSPSSGTLAAGKTTSLTITTNASKLGGGVDSAQLQIGGKDVKPQFITVQLTVQTGLSQVATTYSGTAFIYDRSGLHPAAQTITITNHSSQSFNWYVEYKNVNTWLQVTPDQDIIPPGGKENVRVSANMQGLLASQPETYIAPFSILGGLGQPDPVVLSQFSITLEVKQLASTVTPQVTITPTSTPGFPSITFNAQAPQSTGAPTVDRSGHSMVWDDHDDLFFVFGGIDGVGNLLNDLWSYSPLTGQWTQIDSTNASAGSCGGSAQPAPRMNAAMVWDSAHQQILLFGGVGANNRYLDDLWSYSPLSGAGSWTPIACNNGPGARAANAVWNGNQMLLVGGLDKYGPLADFWAYTPAPGSSGNWQRLGELPMGPRAYQTLVWDSTDSKLFAFGGIDTSGSQQGDLYSYSASAGWTPVNPASALNPLPRQQAIGVWDSRDNMLLLLGGWNDDTQYGVGPYWGMWAYDPALNLWDLLTPLDNHNNHIIPGRTASAMAWDAKDQEAFIYAGVGNGKTGSSLDDLWVVT